MDETVVVYFTSVLAAGVTAQWLAWRLRIPSILVLLGFGVVLGQCFGGTERVNDLLPSQLLFPLVSLSVAVIMLEGGLTLHVKELRDAGSAVFRIVTIDLFDEPFGAPFVAYEFRRQPVKQFGVRRGSAGNSKVIARLDNSCSEQLLPNSIHVNARHVLPWQSFRIGHGLRQGEPSAGRPGR